MIGYLAQKYYTNSLVFFVAMIIFPLFLIDDTGYLVSRAIFWGGLFGGAYTFYDFRKRKIWPLYDNLTHSKYWLLAVLFISLATLAVLIQIFF